MADNKIFAGPRIKRFRRDSGLTQAVMASDLGISPSYLNLIEHNQRPLSAVILLKLATQYGLDIASFDTVEEEQLVTDLEDVFGDPLLDNSGLGAADRRQLAAEQPEWAAAFVRLHRAYRSGHENLNALATDKTTAAGMAQLFDEPLEQVRDFFAANHNYFHALDSWAETEARALDLKPGNRRTNLVQAVGKAHGYRVVERPARTLRPRSSLWDPHNKRLVVALGIRSASKAYRVAQLYCRLSARELIDQVIDQDPGLALPRAREIARDGLVNYTAAALIFPYAEFFALCQSAQWDIDDIADELGISFEQAAHRISTMRRPGASGPAFFFLKVDPAGNVVKRLTSGGFGFPRHGSLCPAWSLFRAQRHSGETLANMIKTPSGQRYLSIAHHGSGEGSHGTVVVGCEARFVKQTAYAAKVGFDSDTLDEPIGPTCRLCSREACPSRALPMY